VQLAAFQFGAGKGIAPSGMLTAIQGPTATCGDCQQPVACYLWSKQLLCVTADMSMCASAQQPHITKTLLHLTTINIEGTLQIPVFSTSKHLSMHYVALWRNPLHLLWAKPLSFDSYPPQPSLQQLPAVRLTAAVGAGNGCLHI
jgi:hypothetical protein